MKCYDMELFRLEHLLAFPSLFFLLSSIPSARYVTTYEDL